MLPLTWVRFTATDMEAALFRAGARTDSDIAAFTLGMLDGIGGRPSPEPPAGRAGWEFGRQMASEAEQYQARQRESGQRGAAKRYGRCGDIPTPSQPHRVAIGSPSDPIATTEQDITIHGGGSGFRGTGKSEQATAAATDGNPFQGEPQEGRFKPGSPATHTKSHPAEDPASLGMIRAATAQPRDASLADMRVLYPALLIMAEDRQAAEVSLRLYGSDAWRSVLGRLCAEAKGRPKGKHRVMFNDLQDALARATKLSVEDYQRAGIAPPPWAVPQSILDAMPPQELERYGTHG